MKWKRFLMLVALLLIPITVYIVVRYGYMDISSIGSSQRNIFADAFDRIVWKSAKTTVNYQTSDIYTDSVTVKQSCSGSFLQMGLLSGGTWLPVNNKSHAFVFSAYFARQNSGKIVIIGMISGEIRSFYCKIWYEMKDSESFEVEEIPARRAILPEGHDMRYLRTYFISLHDNLILQYIKGADIELKVNSTVHL